MAGANLPMALVITPAQDGASVAGSHWARRWTANYGHYQASMEESILEAMAMKAAGW
jgi:hypothetical protein